MDPIYYFFILLFGLMVYSLGIVYFDKKKQKDS